MKRSYWMILASACMMFAGCNKDNTPTPAGEKAKYTVLVYANGGENLDNLIEADLSDAAAFLNTKDQDYSVRACVTMKYSSEKGLQAQSDDAQAELKKSYIPGGEAGYVYSYELASGCIDFKEAEGTIQYLKLNPKWSTDNSAAQMFTPNYISETLKGVAKDLPAENYILIIAGHANGWCVDQDGEYPQTNKAPMSAMTDANFNNRAITAKELAQGIRNSGVNVKAVIFDCCLTNNIEYLSELTDIPGLEYTLASGHTTKGGNYKEFLEQLYEVTNGKKDLKTALCDYAEVYARLHKEDYKLHPNDYMLMNTDFAVVDLAKLKNVWVPLKKVVDFLCENYNAADSAKYEIPSREAYQYYNKTPKYDLMDYLALMMGNGGPYETNEQYKALYNALDDIMETAIVAHAYSLNYVDETKKPKDVAEATMSMSVNIGAKGCLQYSFTHIPQYGYPCYDYKGMEWYVDPTDKDTTWYQENPQYNLYNDWQYSVDKSKFQANTGWYNWVKKNPVMPYNNPPFGDEGDKNE